MKIIIDAGHGGKDPGASGNGIVEKTWCLDMAKRVGNQLLNNWNCTVEYTRTGDTFIEVTERGRIAERKKAKAFLSLHNNAFSKESANGFETFRYSSGKTHDRNLQNAVHDSIMKFLKGHGITNRGKKSANLGVLRTSNNIPSILIEYLFLTNKKEASLLKQESFKDGLAKATAEGVAAYLKLEKKADYSYLNPAPNGARFTRTLRLTSPMMSGKDVEAVQKRLGITADGIYGPKTSEAVLAFRLKAGAKEKTGSVGPWTWEKMFGRKGEDPEPAPKPDDLIRVKVNGEQVGAFSNPDNAVNAVKQYVKAGMTIELK